MPSQSGSGAPVISISITSKAVVEAGVLMLVEACLWTLTESFSKAFLIFTIITGAALLLSLNVTVQKRWFTPIPWIIGVVHFGVVTCAIWSQGMKLTDIGSAIMRSASEHSVVTFGFGILMGAGMLSLASPIWWVPKGEVEKYKNNAEEARNVLSQQLGMRAKIISDGIVGLLTIHYAGWGRGPETDAYQDVTTTMRGLVRGDAVEGVKASELFFGHYYGGEPRRLRVDYSYGQFIGRRTVVFPENHSVSLPEPELIQILHQAASS